MARGDVRFDSNAAPVRFKPPRPNGDDGGLLVAFSLSVVAALIMVVVSPFPLLYRRLSIAIDAAVIIIYAATSCC